MRGKGEDGVLAWVGESFHPPTPPVLGAADQEVVACWGPAEVVHFEFVGHSLYTFEWVGGWVGRLSYGKVEEDEAVRMSYCGLLDGGWVGR